MQDEARQMFDAWARWRDEMANDDSNMGAGSVNIMEALRPRATLDDSFLLTQATMETGGDPLEATMDIAVVSTEATLDEAVGLRQDTMGASAVGLIQATMGAAVVPLQATMNTAVGPCRDPFSAAAGLSPTPQTLTPEANWTKATWNLLEELRKTYVVVWIVENDFVNGGSRIWDALDEVLEWEREEEGA